LDGWDKMLNVHLLKTLVNDVPYCKDGKRKPFSEKTKEKIHRRDKYRCVLCSNNNEIIAHHKYPHGSSTIDNGVTLCKTCHMIVHLYLKILRGYMSIPYWDERFEQLNSEILTHLMVVGHEFQKQSKEIKILKENYEENIKKLTEINYFKILYEEEKEKTKFYRKELSKLPKYIKEKYMVM